MLEKNQIYDADITDYTIAGDGISHIDGITVFIPNAIVGEKVRVRITEQKKTWASGRIVEILEKSHHRVNRECPIGKSCGGCNFWHMDYAEESRLKSERVRQNLQRLAGEVYDSIPLLPAPEYIGYRNKAQYPVAQIKGRVYAGFYRAGTHDVVPCQRCLILPAEADLIKDIIIGHANQYRISAYDETTGKGLLRHIYVRKGSVSKQILVCLVANGKSYPHVEELIAQLRSVTGFSTLVLSVNTRKGNTVLGDVFQNLYGPGFIEDTLCGLSFRLSARSFYQVNHAQAENLYHTAISMANIQKTDLVLDLYCGVGTITLAMAGYAKKVIGVEVVPEAVADARSNAERNQIANAEFFCADAGAAALQLEQYGIRPDLITVDPPRKGLSEDTIEAIDRMSPIRLVYISCDPATLARDICILKNRGFYVLNVQCVDLFPRCAHVETVVLMSRVSK